MVAIEARRDAHPLTMTAVRATARNETNFLISVRDLKVFKAKIVKKMISLTADGLGIEGCPLLLGYVIPFHAGTFFETVVEIANKEVVDIGKV